MNKPCWCAGVIAEQQSAAAQSPSSQPASVSQWTTDSRSPESPGSNMGPRVLLLHLLHHLVLPLPLSLCPSLLISPLPSSLFLSLSDRALFPFDQIQAKTCKAIYRRVVLFYQPVSICGTQKYRGLPGCWRQQCSAAERWGECARERDRRGWKKGKTKETEWQKARQKGGKTELEDAWHLVASREFACSLSGEFGLFLSVRCECKMSAHTVCVPVSLTSSLCDIIACCMGEKPRIRSPSREAGLVEKRQPHCSLSKHRQQAQDTHWVILAYTCTSTYTYIQCIIPPTLYTAHITHS